MSTNAKTGILVADRRRMRLIILAVVVAIGAFVYFGYWMIYGRYYQSTDDAYVGGDVVQITSEISSTVLVLHVDDTQQVQRGQTLLELDPADAQVASSSAEANLGRAVRQVRAQFAQSSQLHDQITERTIELKRAKDDYERRSRLVGDGAVSIEELSHIQDNVSQLQAGLNAARDQLKATDTQIDGTEISTNPQVLAATAAVRDAALALKRTKIIAPVTGVIVRRSVQLGQRVAPGAPLMAVVPLDQLWVDANFKEGQLERMRVGQPVQLHADLYGSHADFNGIVIGLAAGSGNAFALLPPQNASGNWIKIVQRVPVRINLDPQQIQQHPLRVGLSISASVDVHDIAGTLNAATVRNQPLPEQSSLGGDPAVEARIRQIIEENQSSAELASRSTNADKHLSSAGPALPTRSTP